MSFSFGSGWDLVYGGPVAGPFRIVVRTRKLPAGVLAVAVCRADGLPVILVARGLTRAEREDAIDSAYGQCVQRGPHLAWAR